MSAQSFEIILAQLYTDLAFRNSFLENPDKTIENLELSLAEKSDLIRIDRAGLLLASKSFLKKRKKSRPLVFHLVIRVWRDFVGKGTK